jgi:parallel beta-helix repeat protein
MNGEPLGPTWPGLVTLEGDLAQMTQYFGKVVQDLRHEHEQLAVERRKIAEDRREMEKDLARQWAVLREEQEVLGQMKRRVDAVGTDAEHRVRLNVGGTPYETSLDTLTCATDSMLAAMFSGKFMVDTQPDGSCFFDRDPKLFREILLYLRWLRDTKERDLPESSLVYCPAVTDVEKEGLTREALYFGIDGLVKMLTHNVLEVSLDVNAKYRRISEALQDARDGDMVIVRPGLYMDSFTLNRNVPIQGEGNRSEIIIRSPAGNVVESRSKGGVIRNLTLEVGPAGSTGSPCGDYYCVLISAGSLVVENCEIRNAGLSCVKVVGDAEDSYPIIRGNSIHNASQCGILVTNKAGGLIENNEIHDNRFSGIEIRNGSSPEVVDNRIHDNRQNGVYIHSGGSGKLERNTITNNNFNGINVEGAVTVSGNTVYNNSKRGIYHTTDTILEANDVQCNILGDVSLKK